MAGLIDLRSISIKTAEDLRECIRIEEKLAKEKASFLEGMLSQLQLQKSSIAHLKKKVAAQANNTPNSPSQLSDMAAAEITGKAKAQLRDELKSGSLNKSEEERLAELKAIQQNLIQNPGQPIVDGMPVEVKPGDDLVGLAKEAELPKDKPKKKTTKKKK